MADASLNAKISTTGAEAANKKLKVVGTQAKKTETNVVQLGAKSKTAFKSIGQNAGAMASAVTGPLGGIASRISAVTTIFTSGTAAASAFGVSLAALAFVVSAGVKELDQINVSLAKTEAVLIATGYASGKTSDQLLEQARSIALTTLASTEGIQQAQAKLLTFDKIHGQVFDDAINLTQDLATVFGGDAATQATQLGKALQDPVKGLAALNRVGVSFTEQQKAQVKAMVANGETIKAQGVIIDALKKQVGGAGASVAKDSLAGKFDTAGQRWSEFTEKVAEKTGALVTAGKIIDGMIKTFDGLNDAMRPETASELFDKRLEVMMKIAALEDKIENGGGSTRQKSRWTQQLVVLEAQADQLLQATKTAAEKEQKLMLDGEAAHLASELKQKKEANDLKLKQDKEYQEKKVLADLAFYEKQQEYQAAQAAKLKEQTEQAHLDDEEFYSAVLARKQEAEEDAAAKKEELAAKKEAQEKEAITQLGSTTDSLKALLGEQSAAYKAAAIVETTINTYKSATGAYAAMSSIPYIGPALGAAAAGVAIAAGLANVKAITAARYQGGDVSTGNDYAVADGGEVEVFTPSTNGKVQTIDQINRMMGNNGGGGDINITVIDQTSNGSNDISAEQNDRGEIIVLIRDTVSSDLTNANTKISKAVTQNTTAARVRG